ncbi:MAG TPA: S41 family peptidase [Desulfosporosinus sp.]|nr:S41 family peptidase [Desulfosporosinus sp.]
MITRFCSKRTAGQVLLNFILVIILILSTSTMVMASGDDVLPEIRLLLQNQYVDPVSADVLNAPTVDEMLKRLGDPHTRYFSKEQYQDFLGSIDMRFSGIGINIEMVPEGIKVVSVIKDSPAEEVGLKSGDVLIRAAGQSLVGLSLEEAVPLIRGIEGRAVQVSFKRGTDTRTVSVTRRAIHVPTVSGDVLNGHIGYLDLNSFGSDTPAEFKTGVNQLRNQNVDSWIVDLRDNGGGFLSSAINLAGYFIGSEVAVQIKDRTGTVYSYKASDPGITLSQPVIFLTNENSASASEILTAAVKDYKKATIVGTTTYGKGTVQSMFSLTNGGVLKMTVDHFYSPLGHEINKVGVSPDVKIEQADSLKAAELMLEDSTVAAVKGRTPDYWAAWGELFNTVSKNETSETYSHYYPDYRKVSELSEVPLDKKFTIHFFGTIDWQSVNNTSIELINSNTGERTPSTFEQLGLSDVRVIPKVALSLNTTYWLIIHPLVHDVSGRALKEGALAVAHTIEQ